MNSKHTLYLCLLASAGVATAVRAETNSDIERIQISADLRSSTLLEQTASATVLDSSRLENEGAYHFQDVLNGLANLNWSGGSARPKYFQIRGVGEQELYTGAPNSSVGFIIDDIDLSGLGTTASLYDIAQVEVLRGPQGAAYGSNALAGLIYLKSKAPTEVFEHGLQAGAGSDAYRQLAAYSSGPIADKLQYRVSVQQEQQDGFYNNSYLQDETNQRDELTARAKLRWQPKSDLQLDLTLLHADFNNGYDAWSLDNHPTERLSDRAGADTQKTQAGSLRIQDSQYNNFDLISVTSYANSDHRHAYDGDWANPEYWASKTCTLYDENWSVTGQEPCAYQYWWDKVGNRTTWSQDVRLSSKKRGRLFAGTTDWLLGVYGLKLKERNDLQVDQEYNGYAPWTELSDSHYESTNLAVYGQLDSQLPYGFGLSMALRLEHRTTDYADSAGEQFDPSETMWGGHIALSKAVTSRQNVYLKLARGYKAGGFNMALPEELSGFKEFDTETLYNLEAGWKSLWSAGISSNLALFYMKREDQQVEASQQIEGSGNFLLYTSNATNSTSYGLEWDLNWQVSDVFALYSSLGLLHSEYDDYLYYDTYGTEFNLSGRELAHAPGKTFSLGVNYDQGQGWFANLNLTGKSDFYYSDSHDSKSKGYGILNAKLGYRHDNLTVSLWGRNLTDKAYGVRGFYFGNRPDLDWTAEQYIRYGDPRQLGVTVAVDF